MLHSVVSPQSVKRTHETCYSAPTEFSRKHCNVSKQSVKVSVSTRRECCQECRNNPPEVLNLHFQWLDLGNSS